eukprot:7227327-Prymnesium_polylepis.1
MALEKVVDEIEAALVQLARQRVAARMLLLRGGETGGQLARAPHTGADQSRACGRVRAPGPQERASAS